VRARVCAPKVNNRVRDAKGILVYLVEIDFRVGRNQFSRQNIAKPFIRTSSFV
jgi:hypothetical protein